MTVGQFKRAIASYDDTDSIIMFCNGYRQPIITGGFDERHGSYVIISSESVQPSPSSFLEEDRQIVDELSAIGMLKQFFKNK